MEEKDGIFCPQSPCRVTEGWAVFLYALGIEPDTNASYRERGKTFNEKVVSFVPLQSGVTLSSVSLQIPGEVFCHVINLFGEPEDHLARHHGRFLGSASTEFGHFSWNHHDEGTINVQFTQNDDESIGRTRMPFGPLSDLIDKDSIISIISRYQLALFDPIGCSDGTMAWPDATSPLPVRLAALRTNIERLQRWKRRHDETYHNKWEEYHEAHFSWETGHPQPLPPMEQQSEDSRALIFSARWLEEASRVARRATTRGGDDRNLLEDCLSTLKVLSAENPLDLRIFSRMEKVTKGFMFRKDRFDVMEGPKTQAHRHTDFSPQMPDVVPGAAIHRTLQGFENTTDEWQKQLYQARVDLEWLLSLTHTIQFDSDVVRFIGTGTMPWSKLWQSKVLLQ